jgi:hypothetical protein
LKERYPQLLSCYPDSPRNNAAVSTVLGVLSFTIDRQGQVIQPGFETKSPIDNAFRECVLRAAATWQLPIPTHARVQVTSPLWFD